MFLEKNFLILILIKTHKIQITVKGTFKNVNKNKYLLSSSLKSKLSDVREEEMKKSKYSFQN